MYNVIIFKQSTCQARSTFFDINSNGTIFCAFLNKCSESCNTIALPYVRSYFPDKENI